MGDFTQLHDANQDEKKLCACLGGENGLLSVAHKRDVALRLDVEARVWLGLSPDGWLRFDSRLTWFAQSALVRHNFAF